MNVLKATWPPKRALTLTLVAVSLIGSLSAFAQIPDSPGSNLKEVQKGADRLDLLYRISQGYLSGTAGLDGVSTARVMNHPSIARGEDGHLIARYYGTEVGWAGFLGKRNTSAALAANAGLNVGVGLLGRQLYRRGGRWRILAIGVNILKGSDNLAAGIHNLNYGASIDGRVRQLTGYRGRIFWSR